MSWTKQASGKPNWGDQDDLKTGIAQRAGIGTMLCLSLRHIYCGRMRLLAEGSDERTIGWTNQATSGRVRAVTSSCPENVAQIANLPDQIHWPIYRPRHEKLLRNRRRDDGHRRQTIAPNIQHAHALDCATLGRHLSRREADDLGKAADAPGFVAFGG